MFLFLCSKINIIKCPFPGCSWVLEWSVDLLLKSTNISLVFPALIWRWFCRHQSSKSPISPLYSPSSSSVMRPTIAGSLQNLLQVTGAPCTVQGDEEQRNSNPCVGCSTDLLSLLQYQDADIVFQFQALNCELYRNEKRLINYLFGRYLVWSTSPKIFS